MHRSFFFILCWLLCLLCPSPLPAQPQPQEEEEPQVLSLPEVPVGEVFAIKSSGFRNRENVDPVLIRQAVDRLVMQTTRQPSPSAAWASLIGPNDRVGLKVATAGGSAFSTHRAIVNAVVAGLRDIGIPPERIVLWDRSVADLKDAGFTNPSANYRVRWSYPGKGYSTKDVYISTVLGQLIWGDLDFTRRYSSFELSPGEKPRDNLSSNSHFAKVLTDEVDKVINLPILTAHASAGLGAALYNMTIPNIDNWRRFTSGFAQADPAIAEIYSDPVVLDKVVLHILDGLVGQYAGGPEFQPNYAVAHGTLYASRDPVALDTVALRQIDEWRLQAKMKPAARDATWLQTAREYGLGNAGSGNVKFLP